MESIEGCSKCGDLHLINYTLCTICNQGKLCLRCSIADVPLCKECTSIQIQQFDQIESSKKDIVPCLLCKSVWKCNECKECRKPMCQNCLNNVLVHTCLKCCSKGCKNRKQHNKKFCKTCKITFDNAHVNTVFYQCFLCYTKVHPSLYEQNKCPIKNCPRQWGCMGCYVYRPEGLYCDQHISRIRCVLCLKRYPTHVGSGCGIVKAPEFTGLIIRYFTIETCDRCMKKVRALIESILILSKRKNQPFEKRIMDKMIQYYLTGFY